MREEKIKIKISGKYYNAILVFAEKSDLEKLKHLFRAWKNFADDLEKFGARRANFPEGISENAFSLAFNCPRVKKVYGSSRSFDNFDLKNNLRLQIKATSSNETPTSYGPRSEYDKLYYLDFYRKGKIDGIFDVYEIPKSKITKYKVNKKQALSDQQAQQKRPRFNVWNLIRQEKIKPKICRILVS